MPGYLFWTIVIGYSWLILVGLWTCIRANQNERARMAAWRKRNTVQAEHLMPTKISRPGSGEDRTPGAAA